jgi:hypothetical protein
VKSGGAIGALAVGSRAGGGGGGGGGGIDAGQVEDETERNSEYALFLPVLPPPDISKSKNFEKVVKGARRQALEEAKKEAKAADTDLDEAQWEQAYRKRIGEIDVFSVGGYTPGKTQRPKSRELSKGVEAWTFEQVRFVPWVRSGGMYVIELRLDCDYGFHSVARSHCICSLGLSCLFFGRRGYLSYAPSRQ